MSTTVDPFRDISLDLAPHMTTNRTSTPVETQGQSVVVIINYTQVAFFLRMSRLLFYCCQIVLTDIQLDSNSPASSTNSGETLVASVPSSLYECLERFVV